MYEAMASGTPVVAAICGDGEELLRLSGAGIAVPIGDRDATIQALQSFAVKPEAREGASARGRAYAETYLSLTVLTRRTLTFLRASPESGLTGSLLAARKTRLPLESVS